VLALRVALVAAWSLIVGVSVHAVLVAGIGAGAVFFNDFADPWRAQINGDFVIHILLAAGWIAYREHRFPRVLLAVPAVLGSVYLLPYVFIATFTAGGDLRTVLVGTRHAQR
jgi:hypothetical protein